VSVAAIDERIRALVTAHRPELEHLVDAELDRQIDVLVSERIAARNGRGQPASPTGAAILSETKVCTTCARTLPLSKFEAHRSKCRRCRHAEQRARQDRAAEAEEPPRTDDGDAERAFASVEASA
jgi:hypothetical protein